MKMARRLMVLACLAASLGGAMAAVPPSSGAPGSSATSTPAQTQTPASLPECKTGNQPLFYSPHPLLDARTAPGFSDSVRRQLRDPLRELGYCIQEAGDYRAILDTSRYAENLVLQTQATEEGGGSGTVLVALLRVRELARGRLAEALTRPLVSLHFGPGEVSTLPNILVKKISENLRSQYVADLLIRSHPDGADVRTPSGLEGRTPVEWVMPLGIVEVTLEKDGWAPMKREIDLSVPGLHAYDLQLSKRHFYNSRFIYPALATGAISLIAFGFENHYFSRYQALGAVDRKDRPEVFGDTFHTAKTYEGIAYTALGLAWLNLALCFTF